jgi:hypothetical protein
MQLHNYNSLRTIDNVICKTLLPNPDTKNVIKQIIITNDNSIQQINNIFSNNECNQIINNVTEYSNLLGYSSEERDSSRACILDKALSELIWNRLKPFMNYNNLEPYGFLNKGKWIPLRINECLRINKYKDKSTGFTPHIDAPYTKSFKTKSILSVIIYLNDNFTGGNTIFYKNDKQKHASDLTFKELYYLNYGSKSIVSNSDIIEITPKSGTCIIFPHSTIHSASKIISGTKILLRTDIVFRCVEQYDFAFDKKSYILAAKYHMDAQRSELKQEVVKSSRLYEKSLTIRLNQNKKNNLSNCKISSTILGMRDIWSNFILPHLDPFDSYVLAQTCRIMNIYVKPFEPKNIFTTDKNDRYCYDKYFYEKNKEGCLKLTAISCLVNYESNPLDDDYIAQYIPETNRILKCSKKKLYECALRGIKCEGQFYRLHKTFTPSIYENNKSIFNPKDQYSYLRYDYDKHKNVEISYNSYINNKNNNNNNNKMDIEQLFNLNYNKHNLTKNSNQLTITKYKCNTYETNIFYCTFHENCKPEYKNKINQIVQKVITNALIFDFSNYYMKIKETIQCEPKCKCYTITFPKKPYNHASCEGETIPLHSDVEINKVETEIRTLSKIHICETNYTDLIYHDVKYVSMKAL